MLSWVQKVARLVADSFSSIGNFFRSILFRSKKDSKQPPGDKKENTFEKDSRKGGLSRPEAQKEVKTANAPGLNTSQQKDNVDLPSSPDSMAEESKEEEFHDALQPEEEEDDVFYDAEDRESSSSPPTTEETLTESNIENTEAASTSNLAKSQQTADNSSITPSLEPHAVNQAFFGEKGLWAQVPSNETFFQKLKANTVRMAMTVVGVAREFGMVRDAKIGYQRYCKDKTQKNYNDFILALNEVGKGISEFNFTNGKVNEFAKGQIKDESIDSGLLTIRLPMEDGQDLSKIYKKILVEFTEQVKKEFPMFEKVKDFTLSPVTPTDGSNDLCIMSNIEIDHPNASKIFLLLHLAVQKIFMEKTVGKYFELQKEEQLTTPKSEQRNEGDVQVEGSWVDKVVHGGGKKQSSVQRH